MRGYWTMNIETIIECIYICVCVYTDKIMKHKNTKVIYDKFNKIKTFNFNPCKIYFWFYEISRALPQK